MAYQKTTWVDHVVARPRTYNEVTNTDGTKTLTPAFGNVTQQGTAVNAANLNHMEDGIEAASSAVDELNAWKDTLDVQAATQAAQQALADANAAIDAIEQAAASVPEDYTALSEQVAEHEEAIDALTDYGNQIFTGGANGSLTENGVTVSNNGRLYSLSGTGTQYSDVARSNAIKVAVLDGCAAWDSRVSTLQLKAGHTYRFSMQASRYPTDADGNKYYPTFNLFVFNTQNNSYIVRLRPGEQVTANGPTDGSYAYYYCTQDLTVTLQLNILPGYGTKYFTYGSAYKILVGACDVTNEETYPLTIQGTSMSDTPPIPNLLVGHVRFPDSSYEIDANSAEALYYLRSGNLRQNPLTLNNTMLTETALKRVLDSLPATGRLQTGTGAATGQYAVATGSNTTASGQYSHAEGEYTLASGRASHAEGAGMQGVNDEITYNTASGEYSHVEGVLNTASVYAAHAEGMQTTASGNYSHAEGGNTTASGIGSHTEGVATQASGNASHAEGRGTIANHEAQHVFGEFNTADDSEAAAGARGNYVEIVGNGTAVDSRSNARTLDWQGNETIAGTLTIEGNKEIDAESVTEIDRLKHLLPVSMVPQNDTAASATTDKVLGLKIVRIVGPQPREFKTIDWVDKDVRIGDTYLTEAELAKVVEWTRYGRLNAGDTKLSPQTDYGSGKMIVLEDAVEQEAPLGLAMGTGGTHDVVVCGKNLYNGERVVTLSQSGNVPITFGGSLPAGEYILSYTKDSASAHESVSKTLSFESATSSYSEAITVTGGSGMTVSNIMLRPASITNAAYAPYAGTVYSMSGSGDTDVGLVCGRNVIYCGTASVNIGYQRESYLRKSEMDKIRDEIIGTVYSMITAGADGITLNA